MNSKFKLVESTATTNIPKIVRTPTATTDIHKPIRTITATTNIHKPIRMTTATTNIPKIVRTPTATTNIHKPIRMTTAATNIPKIVRMPTVPIEPTAPIESNDASSDPTTTSAIPKPKSNLTTNPKTIDKTVKRKRLLTDEEIFDMFESVEYDFELREYIRLKDKLLMMKMLIDNHACAKCRRMLNR
jgi:hypothetical protein